jgi:AAA domain (dynein-related subfamily)
MAIPKNITKEHIIRAIDEIDKNGIPDDRQQRKFNLKYNGKDYPPKYTISIANKFANGEELRASAFSGGDETNPFLEERGFMIENIPGISTDEDAVPEEVEQGEHDYAPVLKRYLENKYSIKIDKIAGANLRLPSGAVIHAKGSKNYGKKSQDVESWFGLDKNIYEELMNMRWPYMALSVVRPEVTFVLPKGKIQEIFDRQPTKKRPGRSTDRWLFRISEKNGRHLLKLNNVNKTHDIEDYLSRWNEIDDFKNKFGVFLTGYTADNLGISKKNKILGWKKQPTNLSPGDLVFVYNKSSKKIESGFRVKSKSANDTPIWLEETAEHPLVYPYRWNADLLCDSLEIDSEVIRQVEPFQSNKKASFNILILRDSAASLDNNQVYTPLRNLLLSKCRAAPQLRPNTLQDLIDKTSFSKETIEEIKALLNEKKQIIFYGPPGTSKTHFAREFASYFTENVNNITIVQFHPSYSYEDFVEGIRPRFDIATEVISGFSIQPGILKRIVQECELHNDKKFLLIIDEINRGNIPKIFGELLYLLEYRDQEILLTYSRKEKFSLPDNLYIIGTMNSADRAIAFIDYALRRRFYFRNFYPDYNILSNWFKQHHSKLSNQLISTLKNMNRNKITEILGKEYQIGHTYFMVENLDTQKLKRILDYAIIPLVDQYFFGKKDDLEDIVREWQSIVPKLRSDYYIE